MKKKVQYEESSGNIFADLGLSNPEELLAKAEAAIEISHIIKKKHLTQTQAAEILGVDQPKVSAILRGKLRSFSLERLFRFLNALGTTVIVKFCEEKNSKKAHTVIGSHSGRSRHPMAASGK